MSPSHKAVTNNSNMLSHALDKNEAVQESVEQSAAELLVVNAVLSREIPDEVKTDEVTQALERTEELEGRMQASADELAEVNQTLKDEISTRTELESRLAAVQAQLHQAHAQSAGKFSVHQPSASHSGAGQASD